MACESIKWSRSRRSPSDRPVALPAAPGCAVFRLKSRRPTSTGLPSALGAEVSRLNLAGAAINPREHEPVTSAHPKGMTSTKAAAGSANVAPTSDAPSGRRDEVTSYERSTLDAMANDFSIRAREARAAQGLPRVITDPLARRKLAGLVGASERKVVGKVKDRI